MGTKRRYILQVGGQFFTGPKAFYYLADLYKNYYKLGHFPLQLGTILVNHKGWRRRIKPVYDALDKLLHGNQGTLQTFSGSNAKRTPLYRSVCAWMDMNHPRPQTPRVR